uniref:IQ motif containing C n=1 Tax=Electrophorus electricus TaxID=8005 RepID=A0A4W4HJ11_ELEEL
WARCRGYLIRKDLKLVQAEFEDVVNELEGCLDHLKWRGSIIPIPNFTNNQAEQSEKCLSHTVVLLAERDEEPCPSLQRDCSPIHPPPGGDRGGLWSCMALEMSCNSIQQKGVQDVARTPEALKRHRNTLAMELLWIQQAIVSRKKYLSLRQKIEVA